MTFYLLFFSYYFCFVCAAEWPPFGKELPTPGHCILVTIFLKEKVKTVDF